MADYTKRELEALGKADEAFAEVRKVAEEFARQTGMRYHRNVNSWTSNSYFNTDWRGRDNRWGEVHELYDGDNNEAWECSWELERKWNDAIKPLYERYDDHVCGKALAETWNEEEYHDHRIDECLNGHERLRDEMGRIVESWYECASEVAYEEYLLDEEVA